MTANIPNRIQKAPTEPSKVIAAMPDFPFDYGKFVTSAGRNALFSKGETAKRIAIVGAGLSGLVAGYELLRAGFIPIVFEASDRIGGRMYSKHLENGGIAELGAMRFPPTCKALFHYFGKAEMTNRKADFPNPGTPSSPGNLVNYRGKNKYYDVNDAKFSRPAEYGKLQTAWNALLKADPYKFDLMQQHLLDPEKNAGSIKTIWNELVKTHDNESFHHVLVKNNWSVDDIELFGQVGFGSGGWNTNFVNCFLEILRVAYADMETNHQLFFDGVDELPKRLFSKTPSDFKDLVSGPHLHMSLQKFAEEYFGAPGKVLGNVVRGIEYDDKTKKFQVYTNGTQKTGEESLFDAIIYTPHVRVLQMMRDESHHGKSTRALLSEDMWEAIEYTHYMQSSKTFVSAKSAFWTEKNSDGKHVMSTTLSDRVTRGTYLLNYKNSNDISDKAVICLTYTWNDDALKMLPLTESERAASALLALDEMYPQAKISEKINNNKTSGGLDSATIMWDSERFFMGAFKNNLPGQYRYQRALYSHFAEHDLNQGINFFLAGDDISWTGGWSEGAVTTGLNAAHAVVKTFGGHAHNNAGPLDKWDALKPIKLS
ncbi:flavin monoamine oxidase family protein [Ochrobactrum teleogrylli]|uniref:flavin monoamine oxidase family protein n=1 Tax=Ochrobactrum teleogrylli TaxID=2479765 RepID=UPI00384FF8C4